jgi:hypothetical protein
MKAQALMDIGSGKRIQWVELFSGADSGLPTLSDDDDHIPYCTRMHPTTCAANMRNGAVISWRRKIRW